MNDSQYVINRAEKARQLLENELFVESFSGTREAIFEAIAQVDPQNAAVHKDLLLSLKALDRVKFYLEKVIETGEVEKFKIKEAERRGLSIFKRSA